MALNTGLFWPRGGWLKSPGKAVFEFFEPIAPGLERKELLQILEKKIEGESNRLMNEARAKELMRKRSSLPLLIGSLIFIVLFGVGYTYIWNEAARHVKDFYIAFSKDLLEIQRMHAEPIITGYPGPIKLTVADDYISSSQGSVKVENLVITGWPVPLTPVHIQSGLITVRSFKWNNPLIFDSFEAWVTYWNDDINIHDSYLHWQNFEASAAGTIDLKQEPFPKFDMNVRMKNFTPFLGHLAQLGILKSNETLFINAGLTMLSRDGEVDVPITQNDQTLYAGPLPVASLPVSAHQEPGNLPDPHQ
jgi:hypothetical protein